MPATSFNRYSAASSSSSASSTSSTNHYNNLVSYSSSPSSSTLSALRSATSSLHVSRLTNPDHRSMQSLRLHQSPYRTYQTPVARVSPLDSRQQPDCHYRDESWLSCEELETIEKRFADLLQETPERKSEQRAKSCDRLTTEERISKPATLTCKF
jgi:hypothetical protein